MLYMLLVSACSISKLEDMRTHSDKQRKLIRNYTFTLDYIELICKRVEQRSRRHLARQGPLGTGIATPV